MEPANATNTNRNSGEAEGPAVRLSPTQLVALFPSISTHAQVKRYSLICHPERSRGTCGAPFTNATVEAPSPNLNGEVYVAYPLNW
jgi:hypothetical protein